jgi:hypothetical protein
MYVGWCIRLCILFDLHFQYNYNYMKLRINESAVDYLLSVMICILFNHCIHQ